MQIDKLLDFQKILDKENCVTVYYRNIQKIATEMYAVANYLSSA